MAYRKNNSFKWLPTAGIIVGGLVLLSVGKKFMQGLGFMDDDNTARAKDEAQTTVKAILNAPVDELKLTKPVSYYLDIAKKLYKAFDVGWFGITDLDTFRSCLTSMSAMNGMEVKQVNKCYATLDPNLSLYGSINLFWGRFDRNPFGVNDDIKDGFIAVLTRAGVNV